MSAFTRLVSNSAKGAISGLDHSHVGRALKTPGFKNKAKAVASAMLSEDRAAVLTEKAMQDYQTAMDSTLGGFFEKHGAGMRTLSADSYKKGAAPAATGGMLAGAAAGAGKSYYDGDGAGGYARKIVGGGLLGGFAGKSYLKARTSGTLLNSLGRPEGPVRSAWRAAFPAKG